MRSTPRRILVVQLADIGDLVLSTPALRLLRSANPHAHIAVLTTQHAAPILSPLRTVTVTGRGDLVDDVLIFDKHTFDSPKALLKPANLRKALALGARLRRGRYDTMLIFHHFSTRFGALKFAALVWAAGAKRVIGLDNGNGFFLTERLPDEGFGRHHQAEYWLALVRIASEAAQEAGLARQTPTDDKGPQEDQTDEAVRSLPVGRLAPTDTSSAVGVWRAKPAPTSSIQPSFIPAQIGIGDADSQVAHELLEVLDHTRPIVAIHAGSGGYSTARRWEPEKFAAVADALAERHNAQIVLVGGKGDDTAAVRAAMRSPALDLTGKTTLNELAAVLASCTLFIGADSGVMHIAAAAGTRVIAIFGPSNADAWAPWVSDDDALIVRSAPACSPCSYVGSEVGLRIGCAARTCMRMVTPEQVIAAADRLLSSENARLRTADEEKKVTDEARLVPTTHAVSVGTRHASSVFSPPYTIIPPRTPDPAAHHFPDAERIHILGLPVDNITYEDWIRIIGEWIAEPGEVRARQVCTINPEFMMVARRDVNFRNILRRTALCVPDGAGLLWAARRRGTPLRERVTGSDGVPRIAAAAAERGWRLYFLGAAPGVAEGAAEVLRARHLSLTIVGTYSGSPAPDEEDAIVARVNASGADILFVAFGAPEQDKWIARNLPRLRVRMAMGVGGTFDFIARVVPRAPAWMQRINLEWLFRLLIQPWRIGRMLRLPRFVWAVMREK